MTCPACGHPGEQGGPTHAYMSASAACWARYGEVLAREYSDQAYWRHHRALTDAYCGQHSISDDRRARQSLYIHLAALLLKFEDDRPDDAIMHFLRRGAKSGHAFPALAMPEANRDVRIDPVHAAPDAEAHGRAVDTYARAVLDAWTPHHPTFRAFIAEVGA